MIRVERVFAGFEKQFVHDVILFITSLDKYRFKIKYNKRSLYSFVIDITT